MVMLVRAAALTGYAALARECGLDAVQLLRSVDLPPTVLRLPELQISAGKVGRLLELSALAAGREDFGLALGASRDPANLGLAAVVAREAPTLRQGLEALLRYLPLHNQALHARLETLDDACLLELRLENRSGRPMRQSVDLSMAAIQRIMAGLFGADWRPEMICFGYPAPRHLLPYGRLFGLGTRLQFGAGAHGMVCGLADMDRPRSITPTLQGRDARAYLEALLANASPKLVVRARNEVAALLGAGRCSAEALAERLSLSRRTLHRRLTAAGSSYAGLLDAARQELVRQCLSEGPRPLAELAAILNFEEASVVARWFQRRFGCSVRRWCDSSHRGG